MTHSAARTLNEPSDFVLLRAGRDVLKAEADAIGAVLSHLDQRFCRAVEAIRDCSGRVVTTGMGKAGLIGRKLAATFSSTGTPSHYLHPGEAVHGDSGCLRSDDVLLALSNSGETEELLRFVSLLPTPRPTLIAMTATDDNSLARAADLVLPSGRHAEAGSLQLAPSTTTTAMLALGDAVALVVSEQRGFTADDFAVFHPGGSLGRKLRPVAEVMRTGEALRTAPDSASVRDSLGTPDPTGRRTGAVMLTDAAGRLTGIFTDSDLARLLTDRQEEQLDRPIGAVMTTGPRTVAPTATVADAIEILSTHRISELPVIDEAGRPVGLLDITDLIA